MLNDNIPECTEAQLINHKDMNFTLRRTARINNQLPADLQKAVNDGTIQPRFLPKRFITEILKIDAKTKNCDLSCEVDLKKQHHVTVCENTFWFTIHTCSSSNI